MILSVPNLEPVALRLEMPNRKTSMVYLFEQPKINAVDPLTKIDVMHVFQNDPYQAKVPSGWTKILADDPGSQAARPAAQPRR